MDQEEYLRSVAMSLNLIGTSTAQMRKSWEDIALTLNTIKSVLIMMLVLAAGTAIWWIGTSRSGSH